MVEQEKKTYDWAKFDKTVDIDGLKKDIEEAETNGDYPDVPDGKFEISVSNMELGKSKIKDDGSGGDPMLKIQFEILAGEYKGQKIFYNGVMQPGNDKAFGFQVHKNNELLRSLWDAEHDEVDFNGFKDYNDLVLDIAEEIIEDKWNYVLEKGKNKGGYDTYEIVEILD